MTDSIPLARPNITQAEIDAVVAVLRTPFLSLGPKIAEFEAAWPDGRPYSTRIFEFVPGAQLVGRTAGRGTVRVLWQLEKKLINNTPMISSRNLSIRIRRHFAQFK